MVRMDGRQRTRRRLVLGFDAGCMACSDLAKRIEEQAGYELEIRSLSEPQVQRWREQALGQDAPWTPTLIDIKDAEVKAWTGRKMGLALARSLGPVATWRVLQVLGETRATPAVYVSRVPGASTLSRAQFLKGLGGAIVAVSVLSGTAALPAFAASREGSPASRVTTAQRKAIERLIHSSEQYRSVTLRVGKAFDFGRAELLVNGAVGAAAVVVPTKVADERSAVATFFTDLQSNTVLFYDCSVQEKVGSATKIMHYENDEPLVELTFEAGFITLPNARRIRYGRFEREAGELGLSSADLSIESRQLATRSYCSNGCCRRSFNFCQGVTALQCRLAGVVNPLLGAACSFIRSYSNNKRAGCNAFALTRCYNLYGCGCPKMS